MHNMVGLAMLLNTLLFHEAKLPTKAANMIQPAPGFTMHFACNASGPENATQVQADLRYSTLILEFRHEMNVGSWDHEESVLHDQAMAIVAAAKENNAPDIFVYRNTNAGSMFALQKDVMFDSRNDALFLGPPNTDPTINISWRPFNFSNAAASDFFLETIVAEAANESAAVSGVFFDGVDGITCSGGNHSNGFLFNSTISTFRSACALLENEGSDVFCRCRIHLLLFSRAVACQQKDQWCSSWLARSGVGITSTG